MSPVISKQYILNELGTPKRKGERSDAAAQGQV